MAGEVKPVRLVVANTGPIVAAQLGECLELLPEVLSKVHIPLAEMDEWRETLANANRKLPDAKRPDIPTLLGRWTQRGLLVLHELTPVQDERAMEFTAYIHPEQVASGRPSVDGSAIALARTLIDLGEAQALLADERKIRLCAQRERVAAVGSIWLFTRMYEAGAMDFDRAQQTLQLARDRGQFYSEGLVSEFTHRLEEIRQTRGGL